MLIVVLAAIVLLDLLHQPLWMQLVATVTGVLAWIGWNSLKIWAVNKTRNNDDTAQDATA